LEAILVWKLADAKNRFSEVVRLALSEGPQRVTRQGGTGESVIVIAEAEYEALSGHDKSSDRLAAFLLSGGPSFEGVDLARDKSGMREVDL
jgi:prevent-host-death family protein